MDAVRVRGIRLVLGLAAIGCSPAPSAAAIRPDERGQAVAHVRQRGATIVGGDSNDDLSGEDGADHIDGGSGIDAIRGGDGGDFLLAGPGADVVDGEGGDDFVDAGSGDDTIRGGRGHDHVRGGPGGDRLDGGDGNDEMFGAAGADRLDGGSGDDRLEGGSGDDELRGGSGSDRLEPGPGRDAVEGDDGDDVIVLVDPCELARGESIDGGPGHDILLSPLSQAELADEGIDMRDVEEVKLVSPQPSICAAHDEAVAYVEVTGTAERQQSLWRDRRSGTWFEPDGALHDDAEIWTRTRIDVDAVLDGAPTLAAGIDLLSRGGSIRTADGRGVSEDASGVPHPVIGTRYRLRLREVRDPSGALFGHAQEAYPSAAFRTGLFVVLDATGPIPAASAGDSDPAAFMRRAAPMRLPR